MAILKIKDWLFFNTKQFKIVRLPGGKTNIRLKDNIQFDHSEGVIVPGGEKATIVDFLPDYIHIAVRMVPNWRDRRIYQINEIESYTRPKEESGIYSI